MIGGPVYFSCQRITKHKLYVKPANHAFHRVFSPGDFNRRLNFPLILRPLIHPSTILLKEVRIRVEQPSQVRVPRKEKKKKRLPRILCSTLITSYPVARRRHHRGLPENTRGSCKKPRRIEQYKPLHKTSPNPQFASQMPQPHHQCLYEETKDEQSHSKSQPQV